VFITFRGKGTAMRKLTRAEVAAVITVMAFGVDANPNENIPVDLPTVTVTGTYNPPARFTFNPSTNIGLGGVPPYRGTRTESERAKVYHALMCVYAYGPEGKKGGAPGFKTYILSQFGWRTQTAPFDVRGTDTNTSPGPGFTPTNGATVYAGKNISHVFLYNLHSPVDLIGTLAHEYGHQWYGTSESAAQAYEDHVRNAFLADQGRKCFGLTP
jgi:hypothetical protein